MERKPVRIFLDSNVILSGLLSDKGAPRIILDILSLEALFLTGMTGKYNILEIERNLTKKLPQALPVWKQYLPKLNLTVIPLPTKKELSAFLGRTADKDVPVLASAAKGQADSLVTGDKKDFDKLKKKDLPFSIVSPSELLVLLATKFSRE
jgi:predicted nucleic acid-binding protein